MKRAAKILSVSIGISSLLGLIIPSILYLAERISHDQVRWVMLSATILWFISSSFWFIERE